MPCFRVGKRTWNETDAFIGDLKSLLARRIQLTSDAYPAYYGAAEPNDAYGDAPIHAVDECRVTPAMAAGVTDRLWTMSELNRGDRLKQ